MRGWSLQLVALFMVFAALALGQVGNGTITGTVTDPGGGVVAAAAVEAKNAGTGVVYRATTTSTGNYTIGDLPVGTYTVSVTVMGFKTYTHSNLVVAATQTLKEDVPLQLGSTTESVNVTAEASLLTTESGELANNVTLDRIDELPLLGIGTVNAGTSGFRNPYNTMLTLPGVSGYASSGTFTLNGLGSAFALTETMRVDGQDATSRIFGNYDYTQMTQPSADAIQEISYQTSNYSAEYGQAGIAVINMTMRSGTNTYHGSGFDYFVNEDLNAADPFSSNGNGGLYRPRNRRNDFGGNLGGPVVIPKLYNGHNKTFWYFNYEQFLETTQYSFADTVPTTAYTKGDFSAISANGNCSLCATYGIPATALGGTQVDPAGQVNFANQIFDPASRTVATSGPLAGQGYASPFQGNMISPTRFDATSIALQSLFSKLGATAQNSNLVSNYSGNIGGGRYSAIPSVKIDHSLDSKDKVSFYYSENNTQSQISAPLGDADGLPTEIGGYRGTFIPTYTERLNYDRTITPTLLLHLGAGYLHTSFSDRAPFLNFNPSQFSLNGFLNDRQFPSFTGLCAPNPFAFGAIGCGPGQGGGIQNIGTSGQIQSLNYEEKPSFVANTTWVHGKHTYKFGAELYLEQDFTGSFSGVTFGTGPGATSDPFTPQNSYNGYNTGFGYASFLLGDYSSINQAPQENYREGSQQWGLYAQDSWKVTRKLTVDYGLRYDLATPEKEQYGRLGQFAPNVPNANAGGYPGSTIFANNCGCSFYQKTYPYAIGPRLGVAYQIDPKTVFRAGWGINYQFVANAAGATIGTQGSYNVTANSPSYIPPAAQFVNDQAPGAVQQPTWPVSTNIFPLKGSVGSPGSFFGPGTEPFMPDGNENRPPRINQWSVGFQREITRNLVVDVSYVGNRAVWVPGGPLGYQSQLSAAQYAKFGFYPYPGTGPAGTNNLNDYTTSLQSISSTQVIQKLAAVGINNFLPYTGYPTSEPLNAAIQPFPQYPNISPAGSPTGDSKYDSLQIKLTKRLSHGLTAGGAYTWGQGFTRATRQDFFNPASGVWQLQQIPPQTLTFNATYITPKASFFNKWENLITKDWQLGWFSTYQSAAFLAPPVSPTLNFLPSEDIRVAGAPLYNVSNINNIGSYNTQTQVLLNPGAWQACPQNAACAGASAGAFGPAATVYYKDFRGPRTPTENANFGRNFRIRERMNLQIRAEFVNIFNRTLLPPPTTSNPQNPVVHGGAQGQLTAGFGVINTYLPPGTTYSAPTNAAQAYMQGRTGTLIARFSF